MSLELEHVRNILIDTVTLLCKNSLNFSSGLSIQGLIGITIDKNEILLVHINEQCNALSASTSTDVGVREVPDGAQRNRKPGKFTPRWNHSTEDPVRKRNRDIHSTRPAETMTLSKETSEFDVLSELMSPVSRHGETSIKSECVVADAVEPLSVSLPASAQSSFNVSYNHAESILIDDELDHALTNNKLDVDKLNVENDDRKVVDLLYGSSSADADDRLNEAKAFPYQRKTLPSSWPYGGSSQHRVNLSKQKYRSSLSTMPPRSSYFTTLAMERRSSANGDKLFRCEYESCQKTYYDKKNLLRHQTMSHGRIPSCKRSRGMIANAVYADLLYD